MDARRIPYEAEFDVIGAFDVIEHIYEDAAVLQQMHRAVRPGGGIIVTVPQHRFLWSKQDEFSCHFRRYTRGELMSKVSCARVHRDHSDLLCVFTVAVDDCFSIFSKK